MNQERRIAEALEAIECDLNLIARSLAQIVNNISPHEPTALKITQNGENMITGVPAGGSGTFQESFVPTNAALPAGASLSVTWTCDDSAVTLAPSADGTSVVVSVPATDTQGTAPSGSPGSFNLTATGTSAALSGPITSGPVSVPILAVAPPLPTALQINQTA